MLQNLTVYSAKFIIAAYTSSVSPLLPFIMDKLHLSFGQIGIIVGTFSIFNSVLQPFLGWVEDRFGYRYALLWSPLFVGVFVGCILLSTSYLILILVTAASGLAICSFHPASYCYFSQVNASNRGLAISFLLLAASLGFVIGPPIITSYIESSLINLEYLIMLPGFIISILLNIILATSIKKIPRTIICTKQSLSLQRIDKTIYLIFFSTFSICILSMNIYSFVPFLLKQNGQSISSIGFVLSLFALGSAIGPLLGVYLAKRVDTHKVLLGSTLLTLPLYIILLKTHSLNLYFVNIYFLGLFLMVPYALLIEMAQKKAENHIGTVSTILGGFVWGCGGASTIITAKFADVWGLRSMMFALLAFIIVNLLIYIRQIAIMKQI